MNCKQSNGSVINAIKKPLVYLVAISIICSFSILAETTIDFSNRQNDYESESYHTETFVNKTGVIENEADLDAYIRQIMNANHIPGISALIIKGDQIMWTGSYGYANIEENIPVADTTSFMLASISKTVTGTALMQLWERGLFDLGDPINDYLPFSVYNPNYPGQEITFRDLMTHTASLRDNWSVMYYYEGDSPIPLGEYCEEYFTPGGEYYSATSNFFTWLPGQRFTYCNNGIVLVGYLVDALTGVDFAQYCRDSIFTVLNMPHTSWHLEGMDTSNIALPYGYTGEGYVSYGLFGYSDYPAGQLRTSSLDLAKHLMAYLNHGRYEDVRILDSATVSEIFTLQIPEVYSSIGLIWFHNFDGTRWLWQHGGGDIGVSTLASICLEENTGAIVLSNGNSGSGVNAIMARLFEYASQDILLTGSEITDIAGGDGDGIAEAGETVQLVCSFANFFADTVTDMQINFSVDDASLQIINSSAFIDEIAPDDTLSNASQPFEFVIPDDYVARLDSFFLELSWNNGSGSDTLALVRAIGETSILLVADDNNGNYDGYYAGCFERACVPFDLHQSPPSPTLAELNDYEIVFWFTGDYRADPLDLDEVAALKGFMDAGGKLFLSGQGIAAQLEGFDSLFLHDYLKAEYLSSSLIPVLRAGPGGQVFDATDTIAIYGTTNANNQTDPDHLAAVNGGVEEFYYLGEPGQGAVSYSGVYELIFFGFGFEAIVNGDSRWTENDVIFSEILTFFDYQMPVMPLTLAVSPGDPTHLIDHAPEISWQSGDPDYEQSEYNIEVGIDNDWSSAEMWDAGPITGVETWTVYAGTELVDGETYYFRVRINSGVSWSHWYYDQMRMNSCPSVPDGLSPDNMEELEFTPPSLSHTNAEDSEGDVLTYSYELYEDSLLSSLVAQESEYPQASGGTTAWEIPSLLPGGEDYFWRVRAGDGFEYSNWSDLASFHLLPEYICGDASGDSIIDVGDAVYVVNYVFKGGPAPDPLEGADVNGDGICDVGDAVHLINYIFRGGAAPDCG